MVACLPVPRRGTQIMKLDSDGSPKIPEKHRMVARK